LVGQLRNARAQQTPPRPSANADPLPKPIDPAAPATRPTTQPAPDPAKVVITVGEEKVTVGEFNTFLSDLDANAQARVLSHPDGKRKLAEEMVKLKLLSSEAKRQKLDENSRTRMAYEELLANTLLTDMATQAGANEKFFNEHKDFFDEIKARHILIAIQGSGVPGAVLTDTQAKAKADAIKKRLDKGEDFASLARTESDDKGSGVQGGNLGAVVRGMMVPRFEEAAFGLKVGQVSPPVRTEFGYHLIQVIDRTTPTYEQARQRVPMRRMDVLVEELKQAAKPQIDESFFDAPAHAAAPAPTQAQTAGATLRGTR
jgi:parvulin-like peptidyl-prolyl isomerase